MIRRHSLNRGVALSALNSPAGRSVTAAMVVGTMLGVALPSTNADKGSANTDLAPVTDLSADETVAGASTVKVPADVNWQLEQIQVQDAQASDRPAAALQVSVQKKTTPVAAQPATAQQAGETAQKAAGSQESGNAQGDIQQTNAIITRGTRPAAVNNIRQQQVTAPAAQAALVAHTVFGSGSSILSTAMSYVSSPYHWDGTTPSGWDCISFVRYIYGKFGVSIDRYTTSTLSAGTRVPYLQAQSGDILCRPGHVGIYIGNSQNVGTWNPSMRTRVGPNPWVGDTPTVIRVLHWATECIEEVALWDDLFALRLRPRNLSVPSRRRHASSRQPFFAATAPLPASLPQPFTFAAVFSFATASPFSISSNLTGYGALPGHRERRKL